MKKLLSLLYQAALIALLFVGLGLRFYRTDWNQGTSLHPDEYGLTNTLVQLHTPKTAEEYFNTRLSPLSPYTRYDVAGKAVADGPDNGMRWGQWPMILLRLSAELSGNTGYDELRLMGRRLSALADTISIGLVFLIGARLYGHRVGLLAASLSALAVMQIQQSHFMTVDNFATLFAMIAFYACVRIAQQPSSVRQPAGALQSGAYRPDWAALGWHGVFGMALGMALASKINLLPLAGMVVAAGFIGIADLKLQTRQDLQRIALTWVLFSGEAALAALLTFRLAQPMSFRQPSGDTHVWDFHLNPDWVRNMQYAQNESNGIGGGPPGEQWAHRPAIVFPWVNMVLWGMGLPLGLMSWAAFAWAAWQVVRSQGDWKAHLLPLLWTGGYFLFMGTRWVKSIRYFLPIYPFLALLAAWGLEALWSRAQAGGGSAASRRSALPRILAGVVTAAVVLGSLAWATAFVRAVYYTDHTRIQATRWIYDNVPGPFHLTLVDGNGKERSAPVAAPDGMVLVPQRPYAQVFKVKADGKLARVTIPHIRSNSGTAKLHIRITDAAQGDHVLDEAVITVDSTSFPGDERQADFSGAELKAGQYYTLIAWTEDEQDAITINRTVISSESWDEGLPLPFDERDPYGQLYRGVQMEARWYDDDKKRQMYIDTLNQADTIILPSQRAIWSACRIPRTYPMTMAYYRALFEGELRFKLAASFSAPMQLGPLEISDVGGTLAWNRTPALPLFNHSQLAAEEAFSVYDHPPVWIFNKQTDYDPDKVAQFFNSIDLSQVVVEGPREASLPPCR